MWPQSQANRELLLSNPLGTFLITKAKCKTDLIAYDIYYVRNRKSDQRKKVSKKTLIRTEDGLFKVNDDEEEGETYPNVEAYVESQQHLFVTPLLPNHE